ncbi:hypothetical protein UFOVP162_50 [uncultured Caudovirales phage]|uniref:Uncharacterized protein n=1 Tax=uncultured Caudovirales phage TaxID=2100421 RepID=A0A6J7XPJ2_9CAUD|nr:hypothetical protein UFOVP162_50 [uncultured Caudovirales phage]
MKTPEDEAFDEIAKKQGDWGGGFPAKKAMAANKLQEDLINYGTAWSQDGKRIDPMSVYEEPVHSVQSNGRHSPLLTHMMNKRTVSAQSAQEPPSEWAGIKAILDEYGLQAIDFVADFKAALAQPAQEPAFGWINSSELAQARMYGGSVNLWLEKHDCDFPVYTTPPQREWNAALDEAAACIGEITAFSKATQDSFAVYIKGLKR